MTTRKWIGGALESWNNSAEWSPVGVPGPGDVAVLGANASVGIAGTVTLDPATGQPGLIATEPDDSITAVAALSVLSGGLALVGSSVAAKPVEFSSQSGQFSIYTELDVIGATTLLGVGAGSSANTVASLGPMNIAPGGDLVLQGSPSSVGPLHIAGGTLDISGYAGGALSSIVTFDSAVGTLLVKRTGLEVSGFRVGDTIDVTDATVSGALSAGVNGFTTVGTTLLKFIGQDAPGATYLATPDGAGGTFVTTTAEPAATVAFSDQTTGASGAHELTAASGGPAYLQWQYIADSAGTVAMTASVPNVFLNGGSGIKALAATSGQNVLDGGTGSAFLTGGSGTNTSFLDIQGGNVTWDTLANFHVGDSVTIWGWLPGVSTETLVTQAGAPGYTGATMSIGNGQGGPPSNVTFAGMSAAQVASMPTSTGISGGVSYFYIANPAA